MTGMTIRFEAGLMEAVREAAWRERVSVNVWLAGVARKELGIAVVTPVEVADFVEKEGRKRGKKRGKKGRAARPLREQSSPIHEDVNVVKVASAPEGPPLPFVGQHRFDWKEEVERSWVGQQEDPRVAQQAVNRIYGDQGLWDEGKRYKG